LATFILTIGASARAAGPYAIKGSDTLYDVMTQAFLNYAAEKPRVDVLTYGGSGSGNGEKAMALHTLSPFQRIAPMSRNLTSTVLPLCNTGTTTTRPTTGGVGAGMCDAEPKNVLGLDAAVIVLGAGSACGNLTLGTDPLDTTTAPDNNLMQLILGGKGGTGDWVACAHPDRVTAINTLLTCNTGLGALSHFYRRDDSSGTSDTIREKLKIARFCNGEGKPTAGSVSANLVNVDQDPIRGIDCPAGVPNSTMPVRCTVTDPVLGGTNYLKDCSATRCSGNNARACGTTATVASCAAPTFTTSLGVSVPPEACAAYTGKCSVTTGTACNAAGGCPTGETCVTTPSVFACKNNAKLACSGVGTGDATCQACNVGLDPTTPGCTAGFLVSLSEPDNSSVTDITLTIAARSLADATNIGYAGREAVKRAPVSGQPASGPTINTNTYVDDNVRQDQYLMSRRLWLQDTCNQLDAPITTDTTGDPARDTAECDFFGWATNTRGGAAFPSNQSGRRNMDPIMRQFGFIPCTDTFDQPIGDGNLCSKNYGASGFPLGAGAPTKCLPNTITAGVYQLTSKPAPAGDETCCSDGLLVNLHPNGATFTCPVPAKRPTGAACRFDADCLTTCNTRGTPTVGTCR
jgi:hypothetical protein